MADTHQPHPQHAPGPSPRVTRREFANRVAVAGLIIIGLIILTLLLWYTIDVFLLAFAGILLAVLLRAMADAVSFITRLPKGWSLFLGGLVLIVGSVVFLWTLTPRLVVQLEQLHETLPAALEQLGQFIQRYEWGSIVFQEAKNIGGRDDFRNAIPSLAAGAATALTATTTMIVGAVVAIFIGIFLAINPAIYVRGTVRLIPIASRPRAVEVLEATESSLRWWLIGRIIAMAFVGVVTAITLWLLGVPLSLSLGVLAGVLDFIPNVGPIIAAVPALIIAFGESPQTALYVLVAYFIIQEVESYVVTPIVQQKVVSLPPAFTVFIQLLFVVLAGPLGLLLATPLAAAGLVITRGLYVQDVLGDEDVGLNE